MKVRGKAKDDLEAAITVAFPQYNIVAEHAPQGQNKYSSNFLLVDQDENRYLLKALLHELMPSKVNREQATREATAHKEVRSEYVVPLLNMHISEKYTLMLFPFLEGENLAELLKRGAIDESTILHIGISLLRAVSDMWRHRAVHQDLKPENIHISPVGKVTLMDLGSARYNMTPFRGAARTNYAYSSPEQIAASRPGLPEDLRLTLDDRLDVYAVGLVLYKLIEGRHPYEGHGNPSEGIFARLPLPPITNKDIDEKLRNAVYRMLDPQQLNRPHASAALAILEGGAEATSSLPRSEFLYCVTSGTSRILKMQQELEKPFDGIVLEASQVPHKPEERIALTAIGRTVVIDPQIYCFQKPEHQSKKFKGLPYFAHEELFSDMENLLQLLLKKTPQAINLIDDVLNHQQGSGATALTLPFVYVDEFNSPSWDVDQAMTELAIERLTSESSTRPIIKGFALSQELLTSDRSRSRILEYATSMTDQIDGFLVLLDSSHQYLVYEVPWLSAAQELFTTLLSTGHPVVWSRADISGLLFAPNGVSVAVGEFSTQRKFNISDPKQQGFSRRVPHYYIKQMFARTAWPEAWTAFEAYEHRGQFVCESECCTHVDFSSPHGRDECDLAIHMMRTVGDQYRRYCSSGGRAKLIEDIRGAKIHYERLRTHRDLLVTKALTSNVKPPSGAFLDRWLEVLNR